MQDADIPAPSLRSRYSVGKSADLKTSIASAVEIRQNAEQSLDTLQLAKPHMLADVDSNSSSSECSAASPFPQVPHNEDAQAQTCSSVASVRAFAQDTRSVSCSQPILPFEDPLRQSVDCFVAGCAQHCSSSAEAAQQDDQVLAPGCFACFGPARGQKAWPSNAAARTTAHKSISEHEAGQHRHSPIPMRMFKGLALAAKARAGADGATGKCLCVN